MEISNVNQSTESLNTDSKTEDFLDLPMHFKNEVNEIVDSQIIKEVEYVNINQKLKNGLVEINKKNENDENGMLTDIHENNNTAQSHHTYSDDLILTISENVNLIEVARFSCKSDSIEQKYFRGCLWAPDGTCILTAINGEGMQIFEIPSDLYQSNKISKTNRKVNNMLSAVTVPESGTVYDYNWFPEMNSSDPVTCCWVASRQHEPIHMWDAFTGELRCTYRGYDQFDEVETAISLMFTPDGQKVLGGYKKSLKIFQTNIPGRDYTEIKSKCAISALTIHLNHPDMIISGSWNSTMNIFDIRATNLGCLTTIHGHQGGITFLKMDLSGQKLFSGARKDNNIYQWDLRNFQNPVCHYQRNVKTNQRIYFDLSPCGNYLFTGGTDGILKAWNINNNLIDELQFNLHDDCCNGVGFSAIRPIVCTTSGQYHFLKSETETVEDSFFNENKNFEIKYENSLVMWWYGIASE